MTWVLPNWPWAYDDLPLRALPKNRQVVGARNLDCATDGSTLERGAAGRLGGNANAPATPLGVWPMTRRPGAQRIVCGPRTRVGLTGAVSL